MSAALNTGGALGDAATASLYRYVLHLGDTSLILAQRLGEWIGHAPALEEDLALANIGLDLIGQARYLLAYAAELEGRGRTEDDLAFLRDPADFTNLALVEQPNGSLGGYLAGDSERDFGQTLVRQFLIDAWQLELFEHLQHSKAPRLAELAAKALKETRYHFRFSAGWMVRLGDGTPASHRRVQDALDNLWKFTHELFAPSTVDREAAATGIAPDLPSLRSAWTARVEAVLSEATLVKPADIPYAWHGKNGQHSEHLSRLLAEMQVLQRTYPGAQW